MELRESGYQTGERATASALVHFALAVATLVLAAVATYGIPALQRFRPWVPGEALPLAGLFGQGEEALLPEFAEAGNAIGSAQAVTEATRDNETSRVAAPVSVQRRRSSRPRLQSLPTDASGPSPARSLVAPEEYADLPQPIQDPSGEALDSFYAALRATAEQRQGAITRVAHYGDSTIAADGITSTLRRTMQQRFGDAGHGFILVSEGDMHYMHHDVKHRSSDDWGVFPVQRESLGEEGWYGYGGVQSRGRAGAHAAFGTVEEGPIGRKVSRFEIFFQKHRWGAKLRARVDRDEPRMISTRSKEDADGWATLEVPDGEHALYLSVRGGGIAHVYGVALERDVPGVVYDSLGLVGARARRLLNFDAEHIERQMAHRDPDLLVLAFGGNEAGDPVLDEERYKKEITAVVQRMRGDSGRACLLFAPLDQGERNERGRIVTIETLPTIVKLQREVAFQQGCAFFDTFQAMGGERSMWRWYRQRPRLATGDFRHATPAGYEAVGTMFYKAILKGFADYLKHR